MCALPAEDGFCQPGRYPDANPVLSQTNTFGPSLGNALTILSARLLRVGVNLEF